MLRRILKRLSGKPDPKNSLEMLVSKLRESGKFKPSWYLKQYPDIQNNPQWRNNPELHYLLHGAAEGRDPAPFFDTTWYLNEYEDVRKSGVNPLVHYLHFGKAEGRYPNPRKLKGARGKQNEKVSANRSDIRNRLAIHLWGGLSDSALKGLKESYENKTLTAKERCSAAWHAARWHFFTGEYQTAYELALFMHEYRTGRSLEKEGMLLRVFCELNLGLVEQAKQTLSDYLTEHPDDSDAHFAMANTTSDCDEKLSWINTAYQKYGLLPIQKIDSALPLSINNIQSLVKERVEGDEKVSIIMPVYNAENQLHIAVDSLLNQTWQNIDVIIVDDCSPDKTFEVAQSYAARDARVIAIRQEQNAGAYRARNKGLTIASGDFITTHDSDDWSHPQKLETQIKEFRARPNLKGVCTHWIRTNSDLTFTQNWRPNNALTHWSHSSFMFRREVVEELGGWDNVRIGADTEFIWRVKAHFGNENYDQIRKEIPFAFALDDEGSLTRTKITHVRTVYFGLRHIYREICAWWHRNGGHLHIESDDSRTSLPIPTAMLERNGAPLNLDILLISDFANKEKSASAFEFLRNTPNSLKIGLYHWPTFANFPSALLDEYFAVLAKNIAIPVVGGETVDVETLVVCDEELLLHPVDHLPLFKSVGKAYVFNNEKLNDKNYSDHILSSEFVVSNTNETDIAKLI